MKIKRRFFDGLEYVLVCLITLGFAYVLRVAISAAMRMTLDDKLEEINVLEVKQ